MARVTKAQRAARRERIVAAVEEALAAMADAGTAYDPKDIEDQLALYGLLQDLIQSAKDAQSVIGSAVIDTAPNRYDPLQVPGGGVFKTAGGKERVNYDQEALIGAAAQKIAAQLDIAGTISTDGEIIPGTGAFERGCREFAALAGAVAPSFSNWRSGVAKKLGLNLNHYAESVTSPVTHRIEGRSRTT